MKLLILVGALLIAGSILFIGRYQISAVGYGFAGDGERRSNAIEEKVFRLDRWTGNIELCSIGGSDLQVFAGQINKTGHALFACAFPKDPTPESGSEPARPRSE